MAQRSIQVGVFANFAGDGFIKAQKQLDDFGKKTQSVAANAIKNAARIALAFGANALKDFGVGAIEQARDLERSMVAIDTVFGTLAPKMEAFTKTSAEFGLSQADAAKASTFLGSVLKQSGFSLDETAQQTERLVALATDLSVTYGYDVQEALLGMTALFRGEYDPIEKFGVAMKQSEINSELAARGLDKLKGAERRLAEQQVRLEFLYQRSSDAQGAFARGAGTLAVEQKKVEAAFQNMMSAAGEPLLDVLAKLAEQMTPIIEQLTPTMVQMFESLVPVVENLSINVDSLQQFFLDAGEAIGAFVGFLASITQWYIENFEDFNTFLLAVVAMGGAYKVATGLGTLYTALLGTQAAATGVAATSQLALNSAVKANPYVIAATAVTSLAVAVADGYAKNDYYTNSTIHQAAAAEKTSEKLEILRKRQVELNEIIDKGGAAAEYAKTELNGVEYAIDKLAPKTENAAAAIAGIANTFLNAKIKADFFANGLAYTNRELERMAGYADMFNGQKNDKKDETTTTGTAAKDAVKEFYANLKDEIAKQNAKLDLQALGLSEKLIDSVLGSGEDWKKVFDDIMKGGKAAAESLQADFNKTAAGIEELAAIAKQEAERAAAFTESIINQQMALYERLRERYEENQRQIAELTSGVTELFNTFKGGDTQQLGELEQAIVSLTDSLKELVSAQETRLISARNQEKLQQFIDTSSEQMRAVARQRQELEGKLAGAKSLMQTMVDSIVGNVDITKFKGKAESIIKQLRKQVEAQAKFQQDVQALRESGLSADALSQIQDAGVQAGGATARALLTGGQAAIDEVNALYAQLGDIATSAAEDEATAMYGAGVDMSNGLIAGLEAQQASLAALAEQMAMTFEEKFTKALNQGIRRVSEPDMAAWQAYAQQLADAMAAANATLGPGEGYSYNSGTGGYVNGVYLPPQPAGQTTGGNITINLTAGLGVNGDDLGRQLVEHIRKYERRNGQVFVPAVGQGNYAG